MAPAVIPTASAIKARPARGILPSFMKPAWVAKPIIVPAVSKNVTIKNVKTTVHNWNVLMSVMCEIDSPNVGANEGAAETKCVGKSIKPEMIPTIAVRTIPMKIAAGTRVAIKMNVTIMPKIESNDVPDVK